MKISVITIVYNDVKHIEATLLNVIGQTAHNQIEYIVVDGASTDGTSEIIRKHISDIDIYICEPDTGIYNAMNKGLKAAGGDYVIFINCGDRFSNKEVISKVINVICDKRPDVVYGNYRECQEDISLSKVIPCRNDDKIWYGPVASHQSTLYRLNYLRTHKLYYDETYKIAADYKLTSEAIKNAKSVLKTDICISDFDTCGVSSTNQDIGLREANRVRREVFGWGKLRISILTGFLLLARYTKKYAYPIYSILRN